MQHLAAGPWEWKHGQVHNPARGLRAVGKKPVGEVKIEPRAEVLSDGDL